MNRIAYLEGRIAELRRQEAKLRTRGQYCAADEMLEELAALQDELTWRQDMAQKQRRKATA